MVVISTNCFTECKDTFSDHMYLIRNDAVIELGQSQLTNLAQIHLCKSATVAVRKYVIFSQYLTLYLIETHLTLLHLELPDQGLLCLLMDLIRYDPTLVDLTSNFFVLCTNMKVYLYNYPYWVVPSMNIHDGKC